MASSRYVGVQVSVSFEERFRSVSAEVPQHVANSLSWEIGTIHLFSQIDGAQFCPSDFRMSVCLTPREHMSFFCLFATDAINMSHTVSEVK